jgi:hypothetical protein
LSLPGDFPLPVLHWLKTSLLDNDWHLPCYGAQNLDQVLLLGGLEPGYVTFYSTTVPKKKFSYHIITSWWRDFRQGVKLGCFARALLIWLPFWSFILFRSFCINKLRKCYNMKSFLFLLIIQSSLG